MAGTSYSCLHSHISHVRDKNKVGCKLSDMPLAPVLSKLTIQHVSLTTTFHFCLTGQFLHSVNIPYLTVANTGHHCTASYAEPCISFGRSGWSVGMSVCLSVTRWHCVKTMQARIMKSSLTDSPKTLVMVINSSSKNSKGSTLTEGVK